MYGNALRRCIYFIDKHKQWMQWSNLNRLASQSVLSSLVVAYLDVFSGLFCCSLFCINCRDDALHACSAALFQYKVALFCFSSRACKKHFLWLKKSRQPGEKRRKHYENCAFQTLHVLHLYIVVHFIRVFIPKIAVLVRFRPWKIAKTRNT